METLHVTTEMGGGSVIKYLSLRFAKVFMLVEVNEMLTYNGVLRKIMLCSINWKVCRHAHRCSGGGQKFMRDQWRHGLERM